MKTHFFFSSIGSTRMLLAAAVISGVFASAAMSMIGIETGVSEEPTSASTFSSPISLRAFWAPFVASDSSSNAT